MPLVVKHEPQAVVFGCDTLLPVPPQVKVDSLDGKQLIGGRIDVSQLKARKVWRLAHHTHRTPVSIFSGEEVHGVPEHFQGQALYDFFLSRVTKTSTTSLISR